MARITKRSWTEEDNARLIALAESGASAVRISAALKRSISAVQARAVCLGVRFRSLRDFRQKMKDAQLAHERLRP